MRRLVIAAAAALSLSAVAAPQPALAAEATVAPPAQNWSFGGLFGTFDRASAQRGFQVYKEVCAACHGLRHLSYRHLGVLGFSAAEITAIAAEYKVPDFDDDGQPIERDARPSDRFRSPFANEAAGRAANNGAYPPDLSVIVKARADGANYLYALLTGYGNPPAGMQLGEGMHYNEYFPGHQIAMARPLNDEQVTYADGTANTTSQMSRDLTTFLAWAAEPEMEDRKRMGVKVMLFLLILTGLMYASKRKLWSDLH
ncbi:MAG: cytochrome c1 [Alphaproteobacteria bacterium]|nr:cytochrome c1 [Alphaproteobacteria bacterium]